jgi:hypothetical protein
LCVSELRRTDALYLVTEHLDEHTAFICSVELIKVSKELSPSDSGQNPKVEATGSSETSVAEYKSTRRHISEDEKQHLYRHKNFKL